jgi:hypothetical protein
MPKPYDARIFKGEILVNVPDIGTLFFKHSKSTEGADVVLHQHTEYFGRPRKPTAKQFEGAVKAALLCVSLSPYNVSPSDIQVAARARQMAQQYKDSPIGRLWAIATTARMHPSRTKRIETAIVHMGKKKSKKNLQKKDARQGELI